MKRLIKSMALRVPALRRMVEERDRLRRITAALYVEPGHYHSPIPSLDEVRADQERIFRLPPEVLAVRLNEAAQLRLVERLAAFYPEMPFQAAKTAGLRYYFRNPNFSYGDAIVLYAMLRHLEPRRLIEVGSGYSSAATLDTNERFLGWRMQCSFVEPYPDLLMSLITAEDRHRIEVVPSRLQEFDRRRLEALESNDVLFVDSTHVSRVGSDVNDLFFDVLPRLRPGVYIHLHDVFYPFEYPAPWVFENRAWNENYLLRAFLQYNDAFEIVLFNNFLGRQHPALMAARMPLFMENIGGSLWVRKVA